MVFKQWVALAAIGVLAGCSSLPAQGPSASTIAEAPSPLVVVDIDEAVIGSLAGRPAIGLGDAFATDGTGATLSIAVGDVVNVTIYETISDDLVSGLFNGSILPPQTVPRSGQIKIPFAGSIHVAGRSAEAVSGEIARRLQEKTIDPDVLVTVEKRRSNAVSVVGDAVGGGVVLLEPGSERLLDAVAQNGGPSVPVFEALVALTRKGRTVEMPLLRVLKEPRHNVRLMPGDLISVTHEPKTFVAAGAQGRNQVQSLREGDTTLAEGLAMSGGLLDRQADPGGVFVLRFEPREFVEAQLGAAPNPEAAVPVVYRFDYGEPIDIFLSRQFLLRDDDIVFVANAPIVQVQKFLDLFRTTLGTAGTAASISNF